MLKITIDGREIEAAEGTTVLAAGLAAGIDIPHFCYHPAFEPEGTCRMCLVKIEGSAKLELACATKVKDGMKATTAAPEVEAARKDVLEFLLAEHPLDCPVCDKAGECRLQDYYERYGRFAGRFRETREKRNKIVPIGGSLILDNERCVLCTRCVRFLRRVTGTGELGVYQRGVRTWIGLYEGRKIDNNYSGNLVEICPVGAITDSDFRGRARIWLLEKGDSICPHCGRGCNITLEFRPGSERSGEETKVFRVRTRENPAVNGPWICDLGRYAYSKGPGTRHRRLLMIKDGNATQITWDKALIMLSEKVRGLRRAGRGGRIGLILGSFLSNEALTLIRRTFGEAVTGRNYWFADPMPGRADGILLTSERTSNLRGARDLGFELRRPDLEEISESTDLLLIFGTALLEHFPEGRIREALARVQAKFLFTACPGALDRSVDVILPTALMAESSGSATNVAGRIQEFRPVFGLPGDARAAGAVLADLARALETDGRDER
jgi:NADH-quinone oxidoreductase subunit G